MKEKIIYSFILILFSLISCSNPTAPPPSKKEQPKAVKLKLVDVSCTEAFVNIMASDTVLPVNITLNKDEKVLFNFTLTKTDTIVIDTTLQPGKTYIYQTNAIIKEEVQKSDTLQVKSLDTTSNNFTWQTFTFGDPDAGSSELYDAAIISEDDIWCVGEINIIDSSENGYTTYNAVHWDGNKWELKKITINFRGNMITPTLKGIFAFSSSEIWVVGGLTISGDGSNWIPYDVRQITGYDSLSFTKCWGYNYNDIYFSGINGSLAHFHNGLWTKLNSGTTEVISDIWGIIEPVSEMCKIIVTTNSLNNNQILTIRDNLVKDTLNWLPNKGLSGIWFDARRTYVGSLEIWKNENNNWQQVTSTGYSFRRVRGTKINNIYGIGSNGTVHFNGTTWEIIKQRPNGLVLVSGDCNSNMIVEVGFSSSGVVIGQAAISIGTQIK